MWSDSDEVIEIVKHLSASNRQRLSTSSLSTAAIAETDSVLGLQGTCSVFKQSLLIHTHA